MDVLVLRLEAPMVAFGDVMVDNLGRIAEFPTTSALTGLIGNALGLDRTETNALARLQQRLRFACRIDARGPRLTDMQTAQLAQSDEWWTTHRVVGRDGGAATYHSPHIRYRDFDCDVRLTVVCAFDPADEPPSVHTVASAFERPARPLFVGRKPCLPTRPMHEGVLTTRSLHEALRQVPWAAGQIREHAPDQLLVRLPVDEAPPRPLKYLQLADRRNWTAGPHMGLGDALVGYLPLRDCARVS
ncbi:MAG: type I-E CRISPR-associated protein Cas5/CasD [Gemmatimonadaceae bacterium]